MKVRALIVDDERPARKKIRHFLDQDPEMEVIGECENGTQAVGFLRNSEADLIFLDVQMPLLDGFGVLKRTRDFLLPVVIFVTAYEEYAVKAFKASATDYLLKPFTRRRFEEALRKAKEQIKQKHHMGPVEEMIELLEKLQSKNNYLQRLAIKTDHGITLLPCAQIEWMESEDNYILVHAGKEVHMVRESMNAMERSLNPTRFLRIHRRFLVNVDRIVELLQHGECTIVLQNGTKLPVSRRFKEKVKRFLVQNET